MAWNRAAAAAGGPRVQTIQNEYNAAVRGISTSTWPRSRITNRSPLLAFSPIAAGLLSGKYAPRRGRRRARG